MDGDEAMALDPEDVKDDLRAELFVSQTHNTECIEGTEICWGRCVGQISELKL